ncbi:reverse transcriptase domain-containing protein [Patescibacteria group bacterium]
MPKTQIKSMYADIISWDNICNAYLDLYYSFTEKNKGFSYQAVDGQTLYEIEADVEDILQEAQKELMEMSPLHPAKFVEIPKKGGGLRGIYMLPVKERIKCQAIFRVIEPYFEERYSDHLYSFRSTKPSYYASRAVRRCYLRNFNKKKMYVLKMDFHKYSDFHNHEYLLKILKDSGLEEPVIKLVKLFMRQPFIKNSTMMSLCTGTMQGMNLCPLFNNIYVGDMDEYLGKSAHFYRRVGDDFIMFDDDKDKLLKMKEYVENKAKAAKLVINDDKTILASIKDDFDFLGLQYHEGIVSFPEKSLKNIVAAWKKRLHYNEKLSINGKKAKLKRFLTNDKRLNRNDERENFMHYVRSYNLVTDTNQVQKLSKRLFHLLTKFFTGSTTYKNMAKTKKILKNSPFPSFTKLHYLYTHGKSTR